MGQSFLSTWWINSFIFLPEMKALAVFTVLSAIVIIFHIFDKRLFYTFKDWKTIGEYFESRCDKKCASLISLLNSVVTAVFRLIIVLLIGNTIIKQILVAGNSNMVIIVLAAIVAIYVIMGGIKAELYAQFIQATILIGFLIYLSIALFSGNASGVSLDTGFIFGGNPRWSTLVIGLPIFTFWCWGLDQASLQKMVSAGSIDEVKRGYLFSFIFILLAIVGISFLFISQKSVTSKSITDWLMSSLLTQGLFLIMVVIAIMGTLAAVFNSVTLAISFDFSKIFRKSEDQKDAILKARMLTGFLFMYVALLVSSIGRYESTSYYFLLGFMLQVSALITAAFFSTVLWKSIDANSVLTGIWSGLVLMVGYAVGMLLLGEGDLWGVFSIYSGIEFSLFVFLGTLFASFLAKILKRNYATIIK